MDAAEGSDAWLSEKLFEQLKDFNTDLKKKRSQLETVEPSHAQDSQDAPATPDTPDTQAHENPHNLQSPANLRDLGGRGHLEAFGSAFKKYAPFPPASGEVGLRVLDDIAAPTTTLDLDAAVVLQDGDKQQSAATVPIDASDEEILKFLESNRKIEKCETKVIQALAELPRTAYRVVKCSNCNCLFDITSFQSHVCDYDEHNNLIVPLGNCNSISKCKEENLLASEPACVRLLRENQIRIRRFLKDELRYDVNASAGSSTSTNTSTNTNTTTAAATSSSSSSSTVCTIAAKSSTTTTITTTSSTTSNNNNSNNNNSSSSNNNSSSSSSNNNNSSSNTSAGLSVASGSSSTSTSKKHDGPHECTLCERKFVHASGLLRHMEKHAMDLIPTPSGSVGAKAAGHSNTPLQNPNGLRVVVKCTLCGRVFFKPSLAFVHFCEHFPGTIQEEAESDNMAQLPYETYVDDAVSFLEIEAITTPSVHEEKIAVYLKMVILNCILQCEFCDLIFSEVSFLFLHSACHQPDRRFECLSCEIHMRTSKEICTHWQAECVFMRENLKVNQATTLRYFVCNVCENKFQSLDQLHEHRYSAYHFFPRLNKTLGTLQVPCEYCDAILETAHDCIVHYEEKHYKKCKREKDGPGAPKKTRQYLCDICGKSYTQSSHLWQHLRFHQGVKPFACKEPGCSRKFTIRPDLNDHIRKCHTGERPYHCLICGKRFLTGSVFYQHRLIHRGERRYECDECGKRFYRADALKNHQRIHTGEKPFGCLFCTKHFRQRGDRDKHIRARHAHLDANSRLMMQMQKLQLEAAAAAAAAQVAQHKQQLLGGDAPPPAMYNSDVVMVGNVQIPKNILEQLPTIVADQGAIKHTQ